MRARLMLRRDGTCTVLTVPRQFLHYLGWICGEEVMVEILEDKTLHVRPFTPADVPARGRGRIFYDYVEPAKP